MKYIITESQLKLLHEMSDDVPLFIKRRMLAIKDAIEHAMLPTCVVQPEEYDDDLGYANDVFNAVLDELAWDTYKDGLTPEQEDELYDYLREYYLDAVVDYYNSCVDEDDEDLFESEDEIISEQTNVYTDNVEYKKALYKYNREMSVYKAFLEVYQKIPSLLDKDPNYELLKGKNDKFKSPTYFNIDKLGKLSSPSIKMIKKIVGYNLEYTIEELSWWYYFIKKIPNTVHFYEPLTNSYRKSVWSVPEFDKSIYEKLGKPKINKWYKVRDTRNKIGGVLHFGDLWIPLFEKPLTQKPILQKTEPPKTTPLPTQPSKSVPPKSVPPPTVQSTLDKTKPVDFYFGNRVFRASDYQMALEFARKLAIKNFNSNMIKIYEHPDNERWFVGQNDKIYLNKNRYDEDPNKNVYIDPVKMGLSAL